MVTMEEAMRKVTGVLQHPTFENLRPDTVVVPGPLRTVRISGPRRHLDSYSTALKAAGLKTLRPAPAMLVVVF